MKIMKTQMSHISKKMLLKPFLTVHVVLQNDLFTRRQNKTGGRDLGSSQAQGDAVLFCKDLFDFCLAVFPGLPVAPGMPCQGEDRKYSMGCAP